VDVGELRIDGEQVMSPPMQERRRRTEGPGIVAGSQRLLVDEVERE
jgi:hypothetical protein